MTNQTLDEILDDFGHGAVNSVSRMSLKIRAKQAILQWVADTVIGKELDSTTLEGTIETAFLAGGAELQKLQRNKLKQHGWKGSE